MKKFFKWFFIGLASLLLILTVLGIIAHESRPTTSPSPEADTLAQKMMTAVNKTAWDTTNIISWDFVGQHQFLWDKGRNYVKVMWSDNEVLLHTKSVTGKSFTKGVEVTGDKANKLVSKAWEYFCNDSFWLNAVVKAFDSGTSRSLVQTKDGRDAMMVSYETGGVTPGDAYAWILDENGIPKSWKMWVGVIPVGGLEFTWEDWITLDTGAKISTLHKSKIFDIKLKDVKGAASLAAYGLTEDPFAAIAK
ncbi:MAG: hypothetical protein AB8F94_20355 [Saprospiraceae bacterium]